MNQSPVPKEMKAKINKWDLVRSESCLAVSDSLQPHGLYLPIELSRPEYWSG